MILAVLVVNIAACGTSTSDDDILQNGNDIADGTNSEKNSEENNNKIEYQLTDEGIIKSEFAKKIIEKVSDELISSINVKDFKTVSKFVHPIKGVRFTPYTNVSLERDVVFNREETKDFFDNQNVCIWGYYDGVGNRISLTPSKYYEKFIYTEDLVNAETVGYNEALGGGSMIENQSEIYDNAIVAEYYFSGFSPDYAGTDWKSLRMVFEQYENDWKLVGIIHNQWTV